MAMCGLMVLDFFLCGRKARNKEKVEGEGTTYISLEVITLPSNINTRSLL